MNSAEAVFLSRTIAVAHDAGLLVHHALNRCPACGLILPAGDAGFPDLVLAGPDGLLIRELKTQTGIMQGPQKRWGQMLVDGTRYRAPTVGGMKLWDVWRDPVDRVSGRIAHELKAIA